MIRGLSEYSFKVPLKRLPWGRWYTPCDGHGQALPVRLKRPALAAYFGVRVIDVEWVG